MAEYWDVYDKNRVFQNRTIRRGDPFRDDEYYVCCEIWFLNSKGEMLITQRHPDKKAGGLWEFIGGGVLAGETTQQAAVREVEEEIGITITQSDLSLLHVHTHRNYFMDIYLVKIDLDIHNIKLNNAETVDAKWVSQVELERIIENQEMVRSVAQRYILLKNKLSF